MDEPCLVEQRQAIEKLLGENADQSGAEASELVLLYKLVKIDTKQFKHEAKMLSMDKCIFEAQKMVVVILVELRVKLFMAIKSVKRNTYENV